MNLSFIGFLSFESMCEIYNLQNIKTGILIKNSLHIIDPIVKLQNIFWGYIFT